MYTIKDTANKLGISTVAVYKRINRPIFEKYVVIKDEIKYVTEEGFRKLEETSNNKGMPNKNTFESINKEVKPEVQVNNETAVNSIADAEMRIREKKVEEDNKVVLELVSVLKQQLESKDKQIEAVTDLFKETKTELIKLSTQLNATQGELAKLLQLKEKGNFIIEAKKMDRKMLEDEQGQKDARAQRQGIFARLFGRNKED